MHLTQEKLVGLVYVYSSLLSLVLVIIILDFWRSEWSALPQRQVSTNQVKVVQTEDSAIHWINYYPMDKY